jgi:hypothetical protein
MLEHVRAVYREGAFHPVTPCLLPENTEVNLTVQSPGGVEQPAVSDPQERRRILQQLTERMLNNPLPANAPKFTREELHERR